MELSTAIAVTIIILSIIVVLIFTSRSKRKKEKQFLQSINELAEKYHCKVSRFDILNNSVIGFDEVNNFFFLIGITIHKEISQMINLAEIQKCRINELSRMVGSKDGTVKIIDRIDLIFTDRDKTKQDIIVEFYNSNYDRMTLAGELQLAEKWNKIANDKINSLKK